MKKVIKFGEHPGGYLDAIKRVYVECVAVTESDI